MERNNCTTEPEQMEVGEITRILENWNDGDDHAVDDLMPHVVKELRQIARSALRKYSQTSRDPTLQPTAIVNEVYLKLRTVKNFQLSQKGDFYALCSEIIKHIIIDYLRRKSAARRGGDVETEPLDNVLDFAWIQKDQDSSVENLFAFQEAFERLAAKFQRESEALKLKYFLGLTDEEIARSLQESIPTVRRDLMFAKAWIRREMDTMAANIYTEAADIADGGLRQEYLDRVCEGDDNLLKTVAILLKKSKPL